MIYQSYKGLGLTFIYERTSYMHLDYVTSFYFDFDLDLKSSQLLGMSAEEISVEIDKSYARAITEQYAKKINLKANSYSKNGIFQFSNRTIKRDKEKDVIHCGLTIKVYEYSRVLLLSQLENNKYKINKYKLDLNELGIFSFFKKRSILKEIEYFERKNNLLIEKEVNKYNQWLTKEFASFKLSESLLSELMEYVMIFSKKDILKTFVLLDTIVEKFYTFKLSVENSSIGNLQLFIDSSVEEFTVYIQKKIEELRSFDVQMIHGEMFDRLDEARKNELNEFKKAFFNE